MTVDELIASRRQALGLNTEAPAQQGEAGPDTSTPGAFYTQNIGGPAYDYVRNFMDQAMPGHPLNSLIAGAVPETLTQAGVAAGTLLAPQAKAVESFGTAARNLPMLQPIMKRMLGPILGGTLGGMGEKGEFGDAIKGGALGAAVGLPGEIVSGISRWYAGSKLAQRFFKEDPARLGPVVQRLAPEFGTMETPEDFGKKVWQGVAQDTASELYDRRMSAVAERAMAKAPTDSLSADLLINSPDPVIGPKGNVYGPVIKSLQEQKVIRGPFITVQGLMDDIRDLRLKGRTASGDLKTTLDGRAAQDAASQLSDTLQTALQNNGMTDLARIYGNTDKKYARFAEMLRYLKDDDLVDANGHIDMGMLQARLKTERAAGLSHRFTADEFKDLMDAVFRGAPPTVVDQINKATPHMGAHVSESGRVGLWGNLLSMLKTNKYAGEYDVPFVGPKKPSLGVNALLGAGIKRLDKPITLGTEDDSE